MPTKNRFGFLVFIWFGLAVAISVQIRAIATLRFFFRFFLHSLDSISMYRNVLYLVCYFCWLLPFSPFVARTFSHLSMSMSLSMYHIAHETLCTVRYSFIWYTSVVSALYQRFYTSAHTFGLSMPKKKQQQQQKTNEEKESNTFIWKVEAQCPSIRRRANENIMCICVYWNCMAHVMPSTVFGAR